MQCPFEIKSRNRYKAPCQAASKAGKSEKILDRAQGRLENGCHKVKQKEKGKPCKQRMQGLFLSFRSCNKSPRGNGSTSLICAASGNDVASATQTNEKTDPAGSVRLLLISNVQALLFFPVLAFSFPKAPL